jgi:phosphoadenosine phosphosulfate reductase
MMADKSDKKFQDAVSLVKSSLVISKNPCVCFSGGKNSIVLLNMLREECPDSMAVIYIDTGSEFPEIQAFVQKMSRLWKLNLIIMKPEKLSEKNPDPKICPCNNLKKTVLNEIIAKNNYDCVFIGETTESQPLLSEIMPAQTASQPIIVTPLISFANSDIWDIIRKFNLPFCSLYEKGFQKIDCISCSNLESKPDAAINQDDEKIIREKLKKLGYL